jgi:type IV pilus assembly protein PilO
MEKFLEQFSKVPLQQKLLGLGLFIVAVAGITYLNWISSKLEVMEMNEERIQGQQAELVKLQQQAQHRTQFMREVERLRQRLREAEEQLPKQAEVEKLLRDVAYEAQQSGLQLSRFELQPEQSQGDFSAVPVRMKVRGSYHEIAVFLDRLSKMPRIVNVTDLKMSKPTIENKKIVLDSEYLATTYRFLEQAATGQDAKGSGPSLKK